MDPCQLGRREPRLVRANRSGLIALARITWIAPCRQSPLGGLVASFPRDQIVFCISVGLENTYQRIRGVDFRAYLHSPQAILETARRVGFVVAFDDRDVVWHGVVFEKGA